jgi:hypothetical protein
MKMHLYLAGLLGLIVLGNFIAESPQNASLRLVFYAFGFYIVGYIVYDLITKALNKKAEIAATAQ